MVWFLRDLATVRAWRRSFWKISHRQLERFSGRGRGAHPQSFTLSLLKVARGLSVTIPTASFHRRTLPDNLIALSSPTGRAIFKEALDNGTMECYFPLSEQFVTQSEPSYCSLSSLAMVLNALNHDPRKTWKGVWRWVSEESLFCDSKRVQCGHSQEKVKTGGMNFEDFQALQVCQPGIMIQSFPVTDDNPAPFRSLVIRSCEATKHDSFLISNFSRAVLNQTGDGHFSPIGGYHAASDSVLILDVARFKYPPYWVTVDLLWRAMRAIDSQSQRSRGYFLVSSQYISSSAPSPSLSSSESCGLHPSS
jgi:glutathione gamma-glutamylcysteinyltransferase